MQMQIRKGQQGFTIIELVVVILLLGILAATALPRFIDVTTQAHDSVFSGVGGSFTTGTALYRAEWVARGQPEAGTELASYGNLRVAPGFSTGSYTAAVPGTSASSYTPVNPASAFFNGRASGYPYAVGTAPANLNAFTQEQCRDVFVNLLQNGAPDAVAAASTQQTAFAAATTAAAIRTAVSDAQDASAADFQIFVRSVNVDTTFAANDDSNPSLPANNAGEARNHQQPAPACVYAYSAEAENYNRFLLYVPWNGRTEVFTTAESLLAALNAFDGPEV